MTEVGRLQSLKSSVLARLGFLRSTERQPADPQGAKITQQDQRPEEFSKQFFLQAFISWCLWACLGVCAYLCCYTSHPFRPKTEALQQKPELKELFTKGHWGCFENSSICLWSLFCPCVRWSDNTRLAGHMTFWNAFALFIGVAAVNALLNGSPEFGLGLTLLMLYFRQKLRDLIGLESYTCATCFLDFCYLCWCPWCAISQEARIMEEASDPEMPNEAQPA